MNPTIQRRTILLAALLAAHGAALAYEQPPYEVHQVFEGFEIRRYAPYWVVEAEVAGDFDSASNAAFRKLFDYISGNNRQQQKVEMTAPVVSRDVGQKIEMTVPVLTRSTGASRYAMQFMLPSSFTADTVPQPLDPELRVRQLDAQWVAARTYSGRSSERNYRDNEAELLRLLQAAKVVPMGPPSLAIYNGPFTPWFLRRNEVIVPVQARRR
jgi:SOUL heme-binding protein